MPLLQSVHQEGRAVHDRCDLKCASGLKRSDVVLYIICVIYNVLNMHLQYTVQSVLHTVFAVPVVIGYHVGAFDYQMAAGHSTNFVMPIKIISDVTWQRRT